jgi:hypothetical protein
MPHFRICSRPNFGQHFFVALLAGSKLPHGNLNQPGANPTIVGYNASAVKIYNGTISLVRFEKKNIFL